MDGSHTLFADAKDTEEAVRQAEVYARAMESIRLEKRMRQRQGERVLSTMMSGSEFADSTFMKYVRMFLIGFACVMPVIAMWSIAL